MMYLHPNLSTIRMRSAAYPNRIPTSTPSAEKPPITCLGKITDCASCPAEANCTDISVGRLPGAPDTNDWITEACACMCPEGPQACIAIDSAEAEAAIATARGTAREAMADAMAATRTAFSEAINATAPEGVEVGSDEWLEWRIDVMMDAWSIHKNATHEAIRDSREDVAAAIDALRDMFGHGGDGGAAPAPELANPTNVI